jgi:hypothetical protein
MKKFAITWKALSWIRLAYGHTNPKGGTLTEEFLRTLSKCKVVCNHKDSTANKNAYTIWNKGRIIRFPYGSEVWLTPEIINIISAQTCAVDANSYHEDRDNNVTGRGELTSTLEYDHLYDVNVLITVEDLEK